MILFFYTETSGKYNFSQPANHASQPDMMQIALLLADDAGKTRATFSALVYPHWKYEVNEEASQINGLTFDQCKRYGLRWEAIHRTIYEMAFKSALVVAHNIDFDMAVLQTWYERITVNCNPAEFPLMKPLFCTMKATTNICKFPGTRPNSYKWPKLQEAA